MEDLELLKRDLNFEIKRCKDIFNKKFFIDNSIFGESIFIEILIRLNYVLGKLKDNNNRIDWSEDIQVDQKIKDITDLVNNLRNAACHSDSQRNYIKNTEIKFVFNVFIGKCPNAFRFGESNFLGNEYDNEIAFYYGDKRIYFTRHIERLLRELPDEINKLNNNES